LHSPGVPDGGMRNISVPGNFVGGVNYDNPFLEVIGQHPGYLSQHSGLAYTRPSQQQDVPARFDKVLNHTYGAKHGPAHTAGQADYVAISIAYGRDAVKGVVDAGAIIPAELANARHYVINVSLAHLTGVKDQLSMGKTGFGETPQV
jgi:hypothetical protein